MAKAQNQPEYISLAGFFDVPDYPWMPYVSAILVAVTTWIILRLCVALVRRSSRVGGRIDHLSVQALHLIGGLAERTKTWVITVLALYAGCNFAPLLPKVLTMMKGAAIVAAFYQVAVWGNYLISTLLGRYASQKMENDSSAATTLQFSIFIARVTLITVLVLLTLDNLGINISALIAGIGIGGIAIAMAAQNILSDLFASLSIVLDKPFVLGDFIIVGTEMGTIEKIGLKTTRVRSLSGEQLIFPNSDLLKARIRNFKRMQERRIVFRFGVTYQTPKDKLAAIPGMVQSIVEELSDTRFDRAHFQGFGPSSLDFEVVYWLLKPDYEFYMDTQQSINLALVEKLQAIDVEFAFPTQTLYLHHASGMPQSVPVGGENLGATT